MAQAQGTGGPATGTGSGGSTGPTGAGGSAVDSSVSPPQLGPDGGLIGASDSAIDQQGGGGADALPPTAGCTVYASPQGAGAACTAAAPCSLEGVRDKVRTLNVNMKANIEVCLAGGTYTLARTFTLTESDAVHDSGNNGFDVIYRALGADAPVLSGGQVITGFVLADQAKNIYRAHVGTELHTRQLFVNGKRATRARSTNNMGLGKGTHGFNAPNSNMASWKNQNHVELTGVHDWKAYRCPVESISGTSVRVQDPCWELSQTAPGWLFDDVAWVENAYELLDQEGEFYLDESTGDLFYKPLAGEDLAKATVVAPVLETLVKGQGTIASPLHNIVFRGLTVAYGTWLEPSTSLGYTPWQAGFLYRTVKNYSDDQFYVTPSNLVFDAVKSIRLERNRFLHLGAGGLDIFHGSSDNVIIGNRFEDISGRGITLGHLGDANIPDPEVIKNNVIRNNYMLGAGVEYNDGVFLFIGYTQATVVEHNHFRYAPYIGISLGWGWNSHPSTVAKDNIIRWNRVEDFMTMTFDGSGIYSLGVQRGSSIDHNYIFKGLPRGEGIFPDQGSSFMTWESNVIQDVGWQWIHDWSSQAHDNIIRNNITNQPNYEYKGANDVFTNNVVISNNVWPQEAKDIMAKAGLEAEYADLAK